MRQYTVTYTTDKRPTGLPEGADVKVSGSAYPFTMKLDGKTLYVTKSVDGEGRAFVDFGYSCGHLSKDETRDLYEALAEIVGEEPTESEPVKLPVTATSIFGKTVTVRRSDEDSDEATLRVVDNARDVIPVSGLNLRRDEAHKLGRALLSI